MPVIKYKSPFGVITIQEKNGAISRVYLPNNEPGDFVGADNPVRPQLLLNAKQQFEEYFAGERRIFDLPLNFDGCTDFMKRVYHELMRVPYGETASYKTIAERIGSPRAYRAVGLANNKNPLAILVPCHRIVGADGGLVGYAGGLALKQKLLELEHKYKY